MLKDIYAYEASKPQTGLNPAIIILDDPKLANDPVLRESELRLFEALVQTVKNSTPEAKAGIRAEREAAYAAELAAAPPRPVVALQSVATPPQSNKPQLAAGTPPAQTANADLLVKPVPPVVPVNARNKPPPPPTTTPAPAADIDADASSSAPKPHRPGHSN